MRRRSLFLVVALVCAPFVFAQRSQPSPGVGNAVLLATNSIQMDHDCVVLSGDVIVNDATAGAVLGEAALSLDKNTTTPAGYKIAGASIDLDQNAVVSGDAYYNTLTNAGTIMGAQFTPLALPVYASLPPVLVRPAGTSNVTLNSGTGTLDEGDYGDLTIGRGAKLTLTGGGYAFKSITIARDAELRYSAPADIVVSGRADLGTNAVIAPSIGSTVTPSSMRIQIDGINGSTGTLLATPPAVRVGQNGSVFGTLYATAGSLVLEQGFTGNGAFFASDILVGQGSHFTINSAFNAPPSGDSQIVLDRKSVV